MSYDGDPLALDGLGGQESLACDGQEGFGPAAVPAPDPLAGALPDLGPESAEPPAVVSVETRYADGSTRLDTDLDGDGYVDLVRIDVDGDGLADVGYQDTDGDGRFDSVQRDTNRDGRIDQVLEDSDGDGRPDTWIFDENHDGRPDVVRIDLDEDGRADQLLVDTDHDGVIDQVTYQDLEVDPYVTG
jgi:hypothetical protein